MKFTLITTLTLLSFQLFAQINMADSTVQTIGFWDKGEKQVYTISHEKLKLKDADTTSREMMKYEVEVTIKDSTANSYIIEWLYKNFTSNDENKLVQQIVGLSDNISVLIKTDEYGAIQEVVNWEEVRDHMHGMLKKLKAANKNTPHINEIIGQVEKLYATKEAIEKSSIRDAQQFYTFHGAQYKLGETLRANSKGPNAFGGEPFDIENVVYLDEINEADNNYIMRAEQRIDPKQLTDATFAYLSDISKKIGGKPIKREDMKDLSNEIATASRIHNAGWVIYSIQTTTITSETTTNIEERIIELQ